VKARAILALSAVLVVSATFLSAGAPAGAQESPCPAPKQAMSFAPQTYVEQGRASGESTVETHPDGTLLYGGHASTTLFYAPAAADPNSAAYLQNYTGQAYVWWSDDNGKTWKFVPRHIPPSNVPLTGFSDPDWAIDSAGQVYFSEINLVNVAMSRSTDSSRSYALRNFFAQTITDRQWTEADQRDVVYIVGNAFAGGTFPTDPVGNVGHFLYKSKDGGMTFSAGVADGDGLGDLQVDKRDGTLYEAYYDGDVLSMAAYRNIRQDDFTREVNPIAEGVDMSLTAHWPSLDVDPAGNVYIVWTEDGGGDRPGGVWYSYSRDRGVTWADPVLVDPDTDGTDIWPWLAVGGPGRVAVSWLEADVPLPGNDSEAPGTHGWRVMASQTLNGLGCAGSAVPGLRTVVATPDPIHRGTVCNGGTVCQAQLIDRRLGDYFTVEIDGTGHVYAGYSDTRQGGMVALPGFVRQSGGPRFLK